MNKLTKILLIAVTSTSLMTQEAKPMPCIGEILSRIIHYTTGLFKKKIIEIITTKRDTPAELKDGYVYILEKCGEYYSEKINQEDFDEVEEAEEVIPDVTCEDVFYPNPYIDLSYPEDDDQPCINDSSLALALAMEDEFAREAVQKQIEDDEKLARSLQ